MKLKSIAIICLLLNITSCTTEDIITEKSFEDQNHIFQKRSNSKMLEFNTAEEMNNYIIEKLDSKTDLLEEAKFEVENNGRIPLLLVYNLEEEGDFNKLGLDRNNIPTVDSPDEILLFLLNEKGEININGYIFRIDGEFVYRYLQDYQNDIYEFLNAYNNNEIRIEPEKVIEFSEHLSIYKHNNPVAPRNNNASKSFSNHYYTNSFNGTDKYMVSQFWNNKFWFYQSIGAATSIKRPKKWYEFWYFSGDPTVKADNRLKYNISFTATPFLGIGQPTTLYYNGYNDCNNCNKAQRTFHWTIDFSDVPTPAYTKITGKTEHWAHWYSSNPNVVYRTITP